ncbi:hypothetical protein GCM10029964_068990 [Kibdelosporangium lantanae]
MDSLRLEVARDAVMTFLTESLPVLLDGEIRDALIAVSSLFPGAVALTAVWARSPGRRSEARQVLRILTLRRRADEHGDRPPS